MSDIIDRNDVIILRRLARQIAEIAAHPIQEERRQLWYKINNLERCRIPVKFHVEEFCWLEVLPDSQFQCANEKARGVEKKLRRLIWQWENLDDDWVTEPVVEYEAGWTGGAQLIGRQKRRPENDPTGAYKANPVLKEEDDIEKIVQWHDVSVDREAVEENREWFEEIFDGILTPVPVGSGVGIEAFDYLCEIRGMENVFTDMLERPDWVEEAMKRIYHARAETVLQAEKEGGLNLNNTFRECYVGGLSYTHELPVVDSDSKHVRLKDLWGFSCAQSAVSISPEMHERFVTQFDREYLGLFGLNSIACCEPVDQKMHLHRTIPNLRRISVSEFNDFGKAAEGIGTDFIYSAKPTGTHAAWETWEPEADRQHIASILDQAKGCHIELINNAISTCRGEPQRMRDWCKIAKELAMEASS